MTTIIIGILLGAMIAGAGAYFFRLDPEKKLTQFGIWNAHKHLKIPGVVMFYGGIAVAIGSFLRNL